MSAGRPTKPTKLHVLHGTLNATRHGEKPSKKKTVKKQKPKSGGVPTPPAWLGPVAVVEWRRVTKAMATLGGVELTDRVMLAQYCHLYATLAEEPERFNHSQHGRLESLQKNLGLCQSARAKMAPVVEIDDDDGDPLA